MTYRHSRVHRDKSHAPIAAELVQAGFSVADLAKVGDDCPDMAVGGLGISILVEIKSHKKIRKSKGDGLTDGQRTFAQKWKGGPVIRAETTEEIINAFQRELQTQCNQATDSPRRRLLEPPNPPTTAVQWTPGTPYPSGAILEWNKGRVTIRKVTQPLTSSMETALQSLLATRPAEPPMPPAVMQRPPDPKSPRSNSRNSERKPRRPSSSA